MNEIIIGRDGTIASDYYQKRDHYNSYEASIYDRIEHHEKQQQHNSDVQSKSYRKPEVHETASYRAKVERNPIAVEVFEDIRPDILLSRSLSGAEDTTTGGESLIQGVVSTIS